MARAVGRVLPAFFTTVLTLMAPPAGVAHHSDGIDKYYDRDKDWVPNISTTFYAHGSCPGLECWTDKRFWRAKEAAVEWTYWTPFNIELVHWQTGDPAWNHLHLAVGCNHDFYGPGNEEARGATSYERDYQYSSDGKIHHIRIYLTCVVLNNVDRVFNYELAEDPTKDDFRATVTHELGHAGGLHDLTVESSPPCVLTSQYVWTMCTGVPASNHYNQRTVQPEDRDSMYDGWDNDPGT